MFGVVLPPLRMNPYIKKILGHILFGFYVRQCCALHIRMEAIARACAVSAMLAIITRFLVYIEDFVDKLSKQLQQNEHIKLYENGVYTICSNIKLIRVGKS